MRELIHINPGALFNFGDLQRRKEEQMRIVSKYRDRIGELISGAVWVTPGSSASLKIPCLSGGKVGFFADIQGQGVSAVIAGLNGEIMGLAVLGGCGFEKNTRFDQWRDELTHYGGNVRFQILFPSSEKDEGGELRQKLAEWFDNGESGQSIPVETIARPRGSMRREIWTTGVAFRMNRDGTPILYRITTEKPTFP